MSKKELIFKIGAYPIVFVFVILEWLLTKLPELLDKDEKK